ncbi:MAG TPA: hypothetical protein DFR83_24190 [Deltaproteobacteria bacterium]|nr:hypothetical protein [Deltaproteobacteria bacterium]
MSVRVFSRVVVLWPMVPSIVWACSGPEAAAVMSRAKWTGWGLWGLTLVLVGAATLRARRLGVPMRAVSAGWVLALAHPGLWIPVTSGDCGLYRVKSAIVYTALAAGVGIWGMVRGGPVDHERVEDSPRP